jgi:hypothetical protein
MDRAIGREDWEAVAKARTAGCLYAWCAADLRKIIDEAKEGTRVKA